MKRLLVATFLISLLSPLKASAEDFCSWLSAGVEKKLNKKTETQLEGELRFADDMKRLSRWSLSISANYKISKHLKVDGGYKFFMNHNAEEIQIDEDGDLMKFIPSLWTARHRAFASLSGSLSSGPLKFSLRQRWQYTYRPEMDFGSFSYITQTWKPKRTKAENISRTRLSIDFSKKKSPWSVGANAEAYTGKGGFQKMRYTITADYKLSKKHSVNTFLRHIDRTIDEDDDTENQAILGIGYKYKF